MRKRESEILKEENDMEDWKRRRRVEEWELEVLNKVPRKEEKERRRGRERGEIER